MVSCLAIFVILAAASMTISSARVIPAEPISVMMDTQGNPILFLREKRAPVRPYPHRAMMFTGYYRPARRSDDGDQATGVFAQGNAVSGTSYLGGIQPNQLKGGPEPIEEPEVSSAEAEAAPALAEEPQQDEGEVHQVEGQEQEQDSFPVQDEPVADPEPVSYDGIPPVVVAEEPVAAVPQAPAAVPKPDSPKKGKKTTVQVSAEEEEDDDEFEEEEPVIPFVPTKGKRRQGYVPNLNNFFPMMFSFPGVSRRAGASGSPPGVITAIANSYSTGKGGVASSVATAYGGAPSGKKTRRAPVAQK